MKLIQEIIKTDIAATSARLKGKCGENDKRTLCERANYFLSEKYFDLHVVIGWLSGFNVSLPFLHALPIRFFQFSDLISQSFAA